MVSANAWSPERGELNRGAKARSVVLVSADAGLRQRLNDRLTQLRWSVRETCGGAAAMGVLEQDRPEAMIVDGWLPDLEVGEFTGQIEKMFPGIDLLRVDGSGPASSGNRSPRRNELLHAIRESQDFDGGVETTRAGPGLRAAAVLPGEAARPPGWALPQMVGQSPAMVELARLIRLVSPRRATVLIEGETGTGKEVVANAVHRLSTRAGKPFVVLNCAAIPESLLEAELFGHTRGAFTGAVTARMGRIEAAHGGTLFLDEIGEMPLVLQAKLLRVLECGELQKVGENEPLRVDVRVIAATHQELERRVQEKTFRLDLYHRLAVFPLTVPALRDRMEDLPLLVEFFLEQMGRQWPRKGISDAALARLAEHDWPGNVRELMYVLERAAILAEDRAEIGAEEVRLRNTRRT
jgi:DNA-binding NtrC family response regulator